MKKNKPSKSSSPKALQTNTGKSHPTSGSTWWALTIVCDCFYSLITFLFPFLTLDSVFKTLIGRLKKSLNKIL